MSGYYRPMASSSGDLESTTVPKKTLEEETTEPQKTHNSAVSSELPPAQLIIQGGMISLTYCKVFPKNSRSTLHIACSTVR